jgi:Uma2 family endonuclease
MGASLEFPRRALTVEDFHRMAEVGVLRPQERVELIEGELLATAPIGVRHVKVVSRLAAMLVTAVGDSAIVLPQSPVVLPPTSEPQPDLALVWPEWARSPVLPKPEDILLLIEVADTTLHFDRTVKAPLYAHYGVPELWIFDVERRLLLRHLDPSEDGYATVTQHRAPEVVAARLLPAARVELAALLLF